MFLNIGKRLWLAVLTLPLQGFGQEIIRDPQNATVCAGEEAFFESETDDGNAGWIINGINAEESLPDRGFIELLSRITSDFTTILTLKFKPTTPFSRNGIKIESVVINLDNLYETSESAYLFYETNQKNPATGLTDTVNDTAIQIDWNASKVRTHYLVSITNITETPDVVSFPQYVYFPESQDCQWYEFMVTTHECFNTTNLDTNQTVAASIRVAYPNISPVSLEVSGDKVLVDWLSGDNSALAVVASLRNGSKTLMTHTGTLPFTYTATGCGQYNMNVAVSPAQCEGEPDFTQSASIGFTILCPTTPTEPETEVTGESSGTLAMYPSLLAVAAIVSVSKWLYWP